MAMGFLESAVVIYLRKLYYPEGFDFPVKSMSSIILHTELLREAATIIMILAVAWLSGKNLLTRFGWFLFVFGIWDLFYYLFLKIMLEWPESLMTWDLLFLIPIVWTGPVYAPILNALSMIFLGWLLAGSQHSLKLNNKIWLILITGAVLIFISYIYDYVVVCIQHKVSLSDCFSATTTNYIPLWFPWPVFASGQLLVFIAIYQISKQLQTPFK